MKIEFYSAGQIAECTEYRQDAQHTSNLARDGAQSFVATAIAKEAQFLR